MTWRVQVIGQLHALADEAAATLAPIARPMWWLDPVRSHSQLFTTPICPVHVIFTVLLALRAAWPCLYLGLC